MSEPDSPEYVELKPSKGWRVLNFRELYRYRELLWVLAARDIKIRYKQSILGAAWAVIQPVTTMLIFSLIFGKLARMPSDGFPYPIYLYSALLPWTFFSASLGASSGSVIGSSHLVSKVYFPRIIIPLAAVGAPAVDMLISSAVLLGLMAFYGVAPGWTLLLAPLAFLALLTVSLGIGILLSALTVAYRDFKYIVGFMLQIWMFATPIIYPVSLIPAKWQSLVYLNPLTGLIEIFRFSFLGSSIHPTHVAASLTVGVAILLIGAAYFEKVERSFADII